MFGIEILIQVYEGFRWDRLLDETEELYLKTLKYSDDLLKKVDPLRNSLILNISIFYFEIKKEKQKAIRLLHVAIKDIMMDFNTIGGSLGFCC